MLAKTSPFCPWGNRHGGKRISSLASRAGVPLTLTATLTLTLTLTLTPILTLPLTLTLTLTLASRAGVRAAAGYVGASLLFLFATIKTWPHPPTMTPSRSAG